MRKNIPDFVSAQEGQFATISKNYEKAIREAIEDYGGMAILSRALGEHNRYIANMFNARLDFKTLRRTALRIADLYSTKNLEHAEPGQSHE